MQQNETEKFFGFDAESAQRVSTTIIVILCLSICADYFGWFGDNRHEELKKSYREKVNLLTTQNENQLRENKELKEQLSILKSEMIKAEIEKAKPKEESKPVAAFPSSGSAGKLKWRKYSRRWRRKPSGWRRK